ANGKVLLAGTWGWSFTASRSSELFDNDTAVGLRNVVLPTGNNGSGYGFTLNGRGGSGAPYTITLVSGTLPTGMNYDSATRVLSGTPTLSGTVTLAFRVTDSSGLHSNTQTLSLKIDPLIISTS